MKYLKKFENVDLYKETRFSSNVIKIDVGSIVNDSIIKKFKDKYPNKWVLSYGNVIFIKDKPFKYIGYLPNKIYHVSDNNNLEKLGIKPTTKTSSPFGYYDLSFFYLNKEDAYYGSKQYTKGANYLYEVDTGVTDKWLNDVNYPIDEEENIITTSEFIDGEYIKLIK
jgi:hypothetical protein